MQYDLVIKNGTLVTSIETCTADLAVRGETIAGMGTDLRGKSEIDASGMLVIPGGIDPHVHLHMNAGSVYSSDDFETGTIAAAYGGTTTILDFVEPAGDQTFQEALSARRAEADGKTVLDYGLHMTIASDRPEILAQIPGIIAAGCSSFKTYTIYGPLALPDEKLIHVLDAIRAAGGMTMVHCENQAAIEFLRQKHIAAGHVGPEYHAITRPNSTEIEAIHRVLSLAEAAHAPVYIVHISTAGGAAAVEDARRRGLPVWGETCPQYLLLTADALGAPDFEGAKYVCAPPLRSVHDIAALWKGLSNGSLQTIGTDHCPFFFKGDKEIGRNSFAKIPGGIPGIESRLSLVYSYGVCTGKLSINQWVEVCSTGPAQIMGLYPQKGTLEIGSDADVVIFNPQRSITLTQGLLHERVDYTPYEGMQMQGWPQSIIRRGEVLVSDGVFVGSSGGGRFLVRKSWQE